MAANDVHYHIVVNPAYTDGTTINAIIADGPLGTGHYRLRIMPSVRDVVDNPLDGDGNGVGGDPYVHIFDISLPSGFVFEGRNNDSIGTAAPLSLVENPVGSGYYQTAVFGLGSIDPQYESDYWSFSGQAGDRVAVWVDSFSGGMNAAGSKSAESSRLARISAEFNF